MTRHEKMRDADEGGMKCKVVVWRALLLVDIMPRNANDFIHHEMCYICDVRKHMKLNLPHQSFSTPRHSPLCGPNDWNRVPRRVSSVCCLKLSLRSAVSGIHLRAVSSSPSPPMPGRHDNKWHGHHHNTTTQGMTRYDNTKDMIK